MNVSGSELTFVDKNMLTDTAPKSDLDQDNGQDTESPTVNTNFLSVENHLRVPMTL